MITDVSLPETILRKAAAKISDKTVFLCDSTKFGVSAPYNLMSVEDADYIITDMKDEAFLPVSIGNVIISA